MTNVEQAQAELKLDNMILKMLKGQLTREEAKKQKIIERRSEKHQDILKRYQNENQIYDDYGFDLITVVQLHQYLDEFRNAVSTETDNDAFIKYLKEQISIHNATAKEMERIIEEAKTE